MAVIQISKIQVRRGLQENLPQLASGELGWSVDEQRLFIGNGTLTEGAPEVGNTEIITAGQNVLSAIRSYTFKGDESTYTSQTGPSALAPVQRSLQNKFDEQISARDFGAVGDGVTDDTAALQRALDEIWIEAKNPTVTGVRRVLHIPGGTYMLGSALIIPPYATIIGDGPENTVIKQGAVDTLMLIGVDYMNPRDINISDLQLQHEQDNNIAILDAATNVSFNRVKFVGSLTTPLDNGNDMAAVFLTDLTDPVSKITFDNCEFSQITYGLAATGDVTSVLVNNSKFDTLYRGVILVDNGSAPRGIKVTASVFDNIAVQAIYAANDTFTANAASYISAFNHFKTVGQANVIAMDSGSIQSTALNFATSDSYSIADLFDRVTDNTTVGMSVVTPAVGNPASFSGATRDLPGQKIVLLDASTANIYTLTNSVESAIIDYSISRNASYRIGTIVVSHDVSGTTVEFDDSYTQLTDLGVTLNWTGAANNAVLSYTTTSTGYPALMSFSLRSFI
jgi:hypothetical protein